MRKIIVNSTPIISLSSINKLILLKSTIKAFSEELSAFFYLAMPHNEFTVGPAIGSDLTDAYRRIKISKEGRYNILLIPIQKLGIFVWVC